MSTLRLAGSSRIYMVIGRLPSTHHHDVCKEIADDLRLFASQKIPFHEWMLQQDLPLVFFRVASYLVRDFDVASGKLVCMDFTPNACVLGPAVRFHQLEEASFAIVNALWLAQYANGAQPQDASFLRDIQATLAYPSRKVALDAYLAEMQMRGDELRKKGTLPVSEERMHKIFAELRESFSADVVPSEIVLKRVDSFFRILYAQCDKKRDTPRKPVRFHDHGHDLFDFGS